MADDDDSLPTVKNGVLSKPYPIKTMGDVNRARVLPPPAFDAPKRPISEPRFKARLGMGGDGPRAITRDEQPKGGFDYVKKRNQLQRELSGGRR
jgi:hypothetical protein